MVYDDFPGWLKAWFEKAGQVVESIGSYNEVGTSWLTPFIDQATSTADERAKWVNADANAGDLGEENYWLSHILAGYYANGPYVSTFFEDDCTGSSGVSVLNRVPDTVQVGSNVWGVDTVSSWLTNGGGAFILNTNSTRRNTYDLGQTTYTLTAITAIDRIHFLYLRFTDNSNFIRLELSTTGTGGTNRIIITQRISGGDTDYALQSGTGLLETRNYIVTATVSPTSIQFQVADSLTPTTYIYDETISNSFNSSQSNFAFGNGASNDPNGTWQYFKAVG